MLKRDEAETLERAGAGRWVSMPRPWEIVRRWDPDIVRRNPGNDRLESSLLAMTRRPIPMASRMRPCPREWG